MRKINLMSFLAVAAMCFSGPSFADETINPQPVASAPAVVNPSMPKAALDVEQVASEVNVYVADNINGMKIPGFKFVVVPQTFEVATLFGTAIAGENAIFKKFLAGLAMIVVIASIITGFLPKDSRFKKAVDTLAMNFKEHK